MEQPYIGQITASPASEHLEKERNFDNDAIVRIPVTDSMVIRDNTSQSNYEK